MNIPPNSSVRTMRATRDGRLFPPSLEPFLTASAPHRPLVATSSLNHASQVPTTEGEGWGYLIAEYRHRGLESREGGLECYASQGSFWFRQCPPHNDQGTFPLPR